MVRDKRTAATGRQQEKNKKTKQNYRNSWHSRHQEDFQHSKEIKRQQFPSLFRETRLLHTPPSLSLIVERPNQTPELSSWFQWITKSTVLVKKKKKNSRKATGKNQISSAYILFCVYCFWIFLSLFFNLWLSPYISIYHYILSFICLLGFIYKSRRKVFFFFWFSFFEELSWEDIPRERRSLETGSVFLNRYFAEAAAGLLGSLWMSMTINPEDACCFAVTQSICVIRELALFCFWVFFSPFVIAESHIFVPKLSCGRDSSHDPEILTAEHSCTL